jgi:O-antigen ligase
VIAAVEAGWGISQAFRGIEVTGSYANKNHFSGLIEMALPFTAAALISPAAAGSEPSRFSRVFKTAIIALIFPALMLALLDSQSKMGLISGIFGLLVTCSIWCLSTIRDWKRWLAVCALLAAGLFVILFLPSDELVTRLGGVLTSSQNAGEGRWPIWMDTLRLIAAFPLFGCGLGNYGTAFLRYQTSVIDRTFSYAHNDYLQLLAELGVAGFLILACVVTPVVGRAFRAAFRTDLRGASGTRYLACGCAGALSAIGLHSLADFNLYIPANAMVLAWILGISASLPLGPHRILPRVRSSSLPFRAVVAAMSAGVVLYAPAWMLFETAYAGNAGAEGPSDPKIPASVPRLLRAVRTDPASALLWCDLGDALAAANEPVKAGESFSSAVRLGPFVPPVLIRAASFQADRGQITTGVGLTARVLSKTAIYDTAIFDWYRSHHIPLNNVLESGIADNPRAAVAYLHYLMESVADFDQGAALWTWMLQRAYVDDRLARSYVELLFQNGNYSGAADAWRGYLGPRKNGYLTSNWIYNGDFETKPAGPVLDWEIQQRDDVRVEEDAEVSHTGHRSLRLEFTGKENVDYQQVRQTVVVPPGPYRFEAYVRTNNITTDEGIGFRIFDPEETNRLDLLTNRINGTNNWTKVTRDIVVPAATRLLEIRVYRKPSLRFDCNISGTAWIDTITLSRNGRSQELSPTGVDTYASRTRSPLGPHRPDGYVRHRSAPAISL